LTTLSQLIANTLEMSVNRYLALDPYAVEACNDLEGRSIMLELRELKFPIYFKVENNRLKVYSVLEEKVDAKIKSSIPVLFKMAVTGSDETLLGSGTEMSGNMDVGRQFRNIFKNMAIDWEEIVSKYTGDIVAHRLGNGVRDLRRWMGNSAEIIKRDVTEYLQEESLLLPAKYEIENYIQQVDEIRQAADRAEARLKIIARMAAKNTQDRSTEKGS